VLSADFYRLAFGVVRAERPAVLHCNDWNTMWVGVAARALLGTRVVYDAHELWPDRNGRPEARAWLLACEWLFVRAAHAVMTTSPAYAAVMARRYRVPLPAVVRNLPDAPAPAANGAPPPAGPPTAVYVGGVTTARGLEQALAALPQAPELHLRVVGPGRPSYVAQLSALADGLGVADRVVFEGPVPPAQVPAAAATAHVGLALIQPDYLSYELTLPNKLFEYLAAGVPVLSSDLPAMRDVVESYGAGRVVAPRDVTAIARALSEMVRPEAHEPLRRAAVAAGRELSWDRERARLDAVYATALGA
jgi:glycosyltransferase involved in cell wall biosynthesis